MYLEIFLADFAVFRVFLGILRDFTEIPEFRGSATARNIRGPHEKTSLHNMKTLPFHFTSQTDCCQDSFKAYFDKGLTLLSFFCYFI